MFKPLKFSSVLIAAASLATSAFGARDLATVDFDLAALETLVQNTIADLATKASND